MLRHKLCYKTNLKNRQFNVLGLQELHISLFHKLYQIKNVYIFDIKNITKQKLFSDFLEIR